ncbi:replicative DNA helicase [Brevibacillus laterosporus]|uniref:replicative DNA helicase n=1 Tax=Brevibacillus laterosporus TaxID=1465 RepID=UPI003D207AF6
MGLEAEQSVLGCILIDGRLIKEVGLTPDQFFHSQHQIIFKGMLSLEAKGSAIDIVTLTKELYDQFTSFGGPAYLTDIQSSVPTIHNLSHYVRIVRDAWKIRQAKEIGSNLSLLASNGGDVEIISEAIQGLSSLEQSGTFGAVNKRKLLMDMGDRLHEDAEKGISYGYKDINAVTNGFNRKGGDLIILAARPSVGKTAFALNVGRKASGSGAIVPFFSLEMDAESLLKRMACEIANIESWKLRDPKRHLSDEERIKYMDALSYIDRLPFEIFDEPNCTIPDMMASCRKLRRDNPDKPMIIMLDYLQLLKWHRKATNRVEEVSGMSRELKIMARELKADVVALSQLSRSVEHRQDKRPMLSDLRESGSIEQDADKVMLLYRDDYYDKGTENKNIVEIIMAKHRNGPTGTVELVFLKEYGKFLSLESGRNIN